jgi:hypothetical protein
MGQICSQTEKEEKLQNISQRSSHYVEIHPPKSNITEIPRETQLVSPPSEELSSYAFGNS